MVQHTKRCVYCLPISHLGAVSVVRLTVLCNIRLMFKNLVFHLIVTAKNYSNVAGNSTKSIVLIILLPLILIINLCLCLIYELELAVDICILYIQCVYLHVHIYIIYIYLVTRMQERHSMYRTLYFSGCTYWMF